MPGFKVFKVARALPAYRLRTGKSRCLKVKQNRFSLILPIMPILPIYIYFRRKPHAATVAAMNRTYVAATAQSDIL